MAGLACLQYHHIINVTWNKLQHISEGTITTLSNAITQIRGFGYTRHAAATASSLAMASFGILLTGSMSAAGFTIRFWEDDMKRAVTGQQKEMMHFVTNKLKEIFYQSAR